MLLAWEQERIDTAVFDIFGYHALQMGLPELDGLRANRMPHRWLASSSLVPPEPQEIAPPRDLEISTQPLKVPVGLHCDAAALPFASNSLDLVVMPHTLETAADPHVALAEAARCLVPDGKLVIVGFNPVSLWAMRRRSAGTGARRSGWSASAGWSAWASAGGRCWARCTSSSRSSACAACTWSARCASSR